MKRATGWQNISTVTYTFPVREFKNFLWKWVSKSNGVYEYAILVFIFCWVFFYERRYSICIDDLIANAIIYTDVNLAPDFIKNKN